MAAAFVGSADSRLAKHIVTDAEYNVYLDWVQATGLAHETVTNSPRAWFSHAIRASNLVERVFADDDVKIVSLDVSDGRFTFEVDVKDVVLGASATSNRSVSGSAAASAAARSSRASAPRSRSSRSS